MLESFLAFCGYHMAHALWSVSDGEMLVPFAAGESVTHERGLTRFVHDDYAQAAQNAQAQAQSLMDTHLFSAAFIDGFYTFGPDDRTDAVHMFAKWNDDGQIREMVMSIPYQSPNTGMGFKVYKPKLREFNNLDQQTALAAFEGFWEGVDAHTEAALVWNNALDQSK